MSVQYATMLTPPNSGSSLNSFMKLSVTLNKKLL